VVEKQEVTKSSILKDFSIDNLVRPAEIEAGICGFECWQGTN